jgi:hypothetical protein
MILLDTLGHLIADSEDELHEFAARLGMKRSWYQASPPHRYWHYDVMSERLREQAVRAGATLVRPRELLRRHPQFHR